MEKILNENEVEDTKVRQEASQKAMKAIVAVAVIFSLATICIFVISHVYMFSLFLNTL